MKTKEVIQKEAEDLNDKKAEYIKAIQSIDAELYRLEGEFRLVTAEEALKPEIVAKKTK